MFKNWTNRNFDRLYPKGALRDASERHWTAMHVAKSAASFLSEIPNAKILDIGAGIGKFAIIGAKFNPEAMFYGIEQRETLVNAANIVTSKLNLSNVKMLHGNFMGIDTTEYTGLYFFNSFYENFHEECPRIVEDDTELSYVLFKKYTDYLIESLCRMPIGTRLVTYYASPVVPNTYSLVKISDKGCLKFWIKVEEGGLKHKVL